MHAACTMTNWKGSVNSKQVRSARNLKKHIGCEAHTSCTRVDHLSTTVQRFSKSSAMHKSSQATFPWIFAGYSRHTSLIPQSPNNTQSRCLLIPDFQTVDVGLLQICFTILWIPRIQWVNRKHFQRLSTCSQRRIFGSDAFCNCFCRGEGGIGLDKRSS